MSFFKLPFNSAYLSSVMVELLLIFTIFCIDFSIVEGQKMETTFPTGTPIAGTDERLVNLKMLGAAQTVIVRFNYL